MQLIQWQYGLKCQILSEIAWFQNKILRQHQLFHLIGTPFQFLPAICGNRNQRIDIVEILIICQTVLQMIACPYCTVDVIKIRIGI